MTSADTRARNEARWPWMTPRTVDDLCLRLSDGMPVNVACAKCGVPRSSYYEARAADAEFKRRTDEALATYEGQMLERIKGATDWKADAWLLEKRFPKRYGKQAPESVKKSEISGPGGAPIQFASVADAVRIARGKKEGT